VASLTIGGIVFACTFVGALLGMLLRAALPVAHLSNDSKDVVKLGMGLIATLAAMVLGLLVASAKSSFDAQRTGLQQMAANIVVLDRGLEKYGPESREARQTLRSIVSSMLAQLESQTTSATAEPGGGPIPTPAAALLDRVRELAPKNEGQRWLQAQALQITSDLAHERWLLREQQDSSIPIPFLVVVIFWLAVLFTSFGLFSPRNPLVVGTLLLCALSVGSAMFLIVALDRPYGGVIRVSTIPLQNALSVLSG
jgi:hypothetical protein